MQDAVLERAAAERFGDLESVPFRRLTRRRSSPRGHTEAELGRRASVDFYEADRAGAQEQAPDGGVPRPGMRDRARLRRRSRSSRSAARTRTKTFWQQGAFGIGGATTFRNAEAIVLVSRRAPEMHSGEDVILVAVCLWQKSVKGKGLFYLRHQSDWDAGRNQDAVPWSAPASEYPGVRAGDASRPDQLRHRAPARDPALGQPELVRARARHATVPARSRRCGWRTT